MWFHVIQSNMVFHILQTKTWHLPYLILKFGPEYETTFEHEMLVADNICFELFSPNNHDLVFNENGTNPSHVQTQQCTLFLVQFSCYPKRSNTLKLPFLYMLSLLMRLDTSKSASVHFLCCSSWMIIWQPWYICTFHT